jgi:MoaA/NifB/PqqE/SkfB family radical SAM enzyme
MSLRCVNIDAGLRIQTNGSFSPCCVARHVEYKDENGKTLTAKENTFEEAFMSPTLAKLREDFANGIKNPLCGDCWQEEELGRASKRIRDNEKTLQDNVILNTPHLFEVNLGNICNLACRMCSIGASINWRDEYNLVNEPGQRRTKKEISMMAKQHNNSFTDKSRIWDEIKSNMKYVKHIDMYGGEPMMIKKQWEILQYSVDQGYAKNQSAHFNTNGTIFKKEYVEILKNFKNVAISFSIDGIGNHFEYIRYPAKWPETENIMETWLENTKDFPNFELEVCFSYQITNVLGYVKCATWAKDRGMRIYSNGVYAPGYYNCTNIKEELKDKVIEAMRAEPVRYPEIKEELEYIVKHIRQAPSKRIDWQKFLEYNRNLDKFRNQSFEEMFPIETELFEYNKNFKPVYNKNKELI